MSGRPAFYDDLAETLAEAWRLLGRGLCDRRSAFHTPTFATIGLDGRPRLRTVVLRAVDPASRSLRFHTDRRSPKIAEIARDERVALQVYEPSAKFQVRLDGRAETHAGDMVAVAAWEASRPMSRLAYGTVPAPGEAIATGGAYRLPAPEEVGAGFANFAAVTVTIEYVETLYLALEGHRRASFAWGEGRLAARWLAP